MAVADRLRAVPNLLDDYVRTWAVGRVWWYRLPLLAWMVWLAVAYTLDRNHLTIFGPINLGIHEMGHVVFSFLGTTMMVLGGTILQCVAPLAAAVVLIKADDCFGVPFCLTWLGTNLCYVAVYMADARARELPLVSIGGGDAYHDWEYLFSTFGLLDADTTVAGLVTILAVLVLWGAVAAGGWVVWRLYQARY